MTFYPEGGQLIPSDSDQARTLLDDTMLEAKPGLREVDHLGDDRVLAPGVEAVEPPEQIVEEVVADGEPDHPVDVQAHQEAPHPPVVEYLLRRLGRDSPVLARAEGRVAVPQPQGEPRRRGPHPEGEGSVRVQTLLVPVDPAITTTMQAEVGRRGHAQEQQEEVPFREVPDARQLHPEVPGGPATPGDQAHLGPGDARVQRRVRGLGHQRRHRLVPHQRHGVGRVEARDPVLQGHCQEPEGQAHEDEGGEHAAVLGVPQLVRLLVLAAENDESGDVRAPVPRHAYSHAPGWASFYRSHRPSITPSSGRTLQSRRRSPAAPAPAPGASGRAVAPGTPGSPGRS
eukprot:52657-Hanusia_phi.AAC.14